VTLRKEAGKLRLEGEYGEAYLAVREVLYGQMKSI
jgi:hypothetical protein